jgi:outer membrane protein assembly factor BamB
MKRLFISIAAMLIGSTMAFAENWPGFRGPTGQGHSTERNLPLHWGPNSNIVWRAEIPGEGWSSPIVWNDRIFVTSTTENGTNCHILAVDRRSGKAVWDTTVFPQRPRRKEGKNSWATPTPVTDGKSVYAVFGGGGVAAVDWDGKLLWKNLDVDFYSRHGLGASPVLHEGLLIMPYDGSNPNFEPSGKPTDTERIGWQIPWDKSFIAALDTKTGKRVWTGKRGMSRIAHISPIILEIDGAKQLVSGAGDRMQGFNLKTGELIWSAYTQGEGVAPSPVAGEGMLFASSGFEKTTLRAFKLANMKGDVTASHIVWEQNKGVPTQPSPIYVNGRLYAITDGGVVTCYNPKSGEVLWQDRVGGTFSASPVFADNKIYFLSEAGETTVIGSGETFNVLARNAMNERCQASFAISDGNIFVRSDKALYCIGGK